MWEVLTFACRPYYEVANKHVVSAVVAGHRLQCPSGCPNELYEIMAKCWATVPTDRISAAQAEENLTSIFHAMKFNQPGEHAWPSTDPHEYLTFDDEASTDPEKEITSETIASPSACGADTVPDDDFGLSKVLTASKTTAQPNKYTNPWATDKNPLFGLNLSQEGLFRQPTLPFLAGNDIPLMYQQGTVLFHSL